MKFIHVADLHLGMHPDANKPWGKNRDQELWDTFERLIEKNRRRKGRSFADCGRFISQTAYDIGTETGGLFVSKIV